MRSLLTILKNIMTKIKNNETAINKKVEIVKLWENASPSSTMATATLTLSDNLSNYDLIMVQCSLISGDSRLLSSTGTTTSGVVVTASWGGNNKVLNMYRSFTFNSGNTITASQGWESTPTYDTIKANAIIPVYIYGIKGVI